MTSPESDKTRKVAEATEALRAAIQRLHEARGDDPTFNPSDLERECTRIAQDTTDKTGMPLDYALNAIAGVVGRIHDGMRRNQ